MPVDELVAPFLSHHVAGLTRVRSGRWLARWGADLPGRLTHHDIDPLAMTLGGPSARELAREAVTYWEVHQWEVAIAQLLHAWGGDDALVAAVRDHYGPIAVEALREDPYRLLAFAPFAVVDLMARRAGMGRDDDRRAVGAVVSMAEAWWARGVWVLGEDALLPGIAACLGDDVHSARHALEAACDAGVLHAVDDATWMGETARRCSVFVLSRIDSLMGMGVTSARMWVCKPEEHSLTTTAAVDAIEALPFACVGAPTRATLTMFAAAWGERVASQGRSLTVVAENVEVTGYLERALGIPVRTLGNNPFSGPEVSDSVLWVATSRCMGCWARFLASHPSLKQLIVMSIGRTGDPFGVTQALIDNYEGAPSLTLTADGGAIGGLFALSTDEAIWEQVAQAPPYDARDRGWEGVRRVKIAFENQRQATLGVCFQLLRLGSVALLIDDPQERVTVTEQWREVSQWLPAGSSGEKLRVVGTADLAVEAVATVVIPVPLSAPPRPWWTTALGKARDRVVWVGPAVVGDGAVGAGAPTLPLVDTSDVLRRIRTAARIGT